MFPNRALSYSLMLNSLEYMQDSIALGYEDYINDYHFTLNHFFLSNFKKVQGKKPKM